MLTIKKTTLKNVHLQKAGGRAGGSRLARFLQPCHGGKFLDSASRGKYSDFSENVSNVLYKKRMIKSKTEAVMDYLPEKAVGNF